MKCSRCGGTGKEPDPELPGIPLAAVPADSLNGHPAKRLPKSIAAALASCPTLASSKRLHDPAFWAIEYKAAPDVAHDQELLRAEAWLTANARRPKRDLARYVHNWLARAQERAAED